MIGAKPNISSVWLNKDNEVAIVFHYCRHAEDNDFYIAYMLCGHPELFVTSINKWHKNLVSKKPSKLLINNNIKLLRTK